MIPIMIKTSLFFVDSCFDFSLFGSFFTVKLLFLPIHVFQTNNIRLIWIECFILKYMIHLNLLGLINEYVILPISIITFFILVYIVIYLYTTNSDKIRSKIFLNFSKFKFAFSLFLLFAFILIFHVVLVYQPHIFYFILNCSPAMAIEIQHFFGLMLSSILIIFVVLFFKCIK